MTDRIQLRGITGRGYHGVLDHERRDGQDFVVDLDLEVDLSWAGASDDLDDTINYAEVAQVVLARIEGEPVNLVETIADRIASDVLKKWRIIEQVTVTVHKPQAPLGVRFDDVAVQVQRHCEPAPVVIALGSNLGDRVLTLVEAVDTLEVAARLTGMRVSGYYESDPSGGPDQPDYINAVVIGRTRLSAPHLLRVLHGIEADYGRVREVRWGARTLDLDLITYGRPGSADEWVSTSATGLQLPHPRAHERPFVLIPWLEIEPDAWLRVGEGLLPVRDIVAEMDSSGVRPHLWEEGL